MSYDVTCRFNDSGIQQTRITITSSGVEHTGNYGDGDWTAYGVEAATRFEATPSSGSSFSHWVYTASGTQYISSTNPLTYNGPDDITIYAVSTDGGGGDGGDTDGTGFYVFTGNSWAKATPYIFSGSDWIQVSPYIYTGSGWTQGS